MHFSRVQDKVHALINSKRASAMSKVVEQVIALKR